MATKDNEFCAYMPRKLGSFRGRMAITAAEREIFEVTKEESVLLLKLPFRILAEFRKLAISEVRIMDAVIQHVQDVQVALKFLGHSQGHGKGSSDPGGEFQR
jgi:hypothetical protein